AEAALASWKRSPAGPAGDALVAALGTLGSELGSHLDVEDAEILPLAADHLTEAEWGSLPGHAMSRFTGDKWMIIGLVREHMSESQRAHMLAGMPPAGREMWLTTGARAFDDFTASLPRS
ncbi:MAG TPA: hypothetical protein VN848_09140, partial [Gemmatimonadales bacterium]|nr:hypothetical protein [Gemmatimonadales bacterium]